MRDLRMQLGTFAITVPMDHFRLLAFLTVLSVKQVWWWVKVLCHLSDTIEIVTLAWVKSVIAFTGRAKAIPRCQHCLSENHTLSDCPDCPLDMQREHRHQQDRNLHIRRGFSSEYCQLFNQIRCRSYLCVALSSLPTWIATDSDNNNMPVHHKKCRTGG